MKSLIGRRQFLEAAAASSLLSAVGSAQSTPMPKVTPWPQDRVAAISLTFDDAMQSQLDNAAPILKRHGLNGTFFVVTGPSSTWLKRLAGWRNLAAEGNEIGSHTVNHPCLLKAIEVHSQRYTPEMMLKEIRESCQDIVTRLGVRRGLTFAYPCGDMTFGPPAQQVGNQARYLDYVGQYCFAARGYNSWAPVVAEDLNPLTIPVLGWTVGKDFHGLLSMFEPVREGRNWGVFIFHGVGGQWLSVRSETLDELAGYLKAHDEIWTATFGDVVRYIQESKALGIEAGESANGRVRFMLTWPMDAAIYDLPLTLKWTAPSSWRSCKVYADGKPITPLKASTATTRTAVMDIPPQTKTLEFEATNS
jgi:peptidoglycan-N-acetylglucosamine deacetylase